MAAHLGDAHNFGRRVVRANGRIEKPRTLFWEWLLLSATSPLRAFLAEASAVDPIGDDAFAFLGDLAFFPSPPHAREGGAVEAVSLAPIGDLDRGGRRELSRVAGRAIALFSWLGLADLHWENLVLGRDARGRIVFAPLDVEMILDDLPLPTETKLLPDADPEVAAICQHACGARRLLPFLGKPVDVDDLVAMAASYRRTLAFLDRHAAEIAAVVTQLPALREAPIRVILRGTDEYVHARTSRPSPPLLRDEAIQLARGDVPYFFRLYGRAGIHAYANEALTELVTLPSEGDVPRLPPLLSLSRALRSSNRKKLREEGLVTVIGAFDHPRFSGSHEADGLTVSFTKRAISIAFRKEEFEAHRDVSAFVSSVYCTCTCGEVRDVFVPAVTTCDAC